ncbi:hypothetical protein NPIL_348241 [Nephila pilipes]|uniref:Uncharacterized protein n=1 Tax=Nephila pilipes TaxID=299642 RepID=A0A8X6UGK5_NEPPI|nr:hypothetical protein NPIL_348241 [Nephila pilipes]
MYEEFVRNLLTNITDEKKQAEQAAEVDRSEFSTSERRTIQCYGCGTPEYMPLKCPSWSRSKGEEKASVNSVNLLTFVSPTSPLSLMG